MRKIDGYEIFAELKRGPATTIFKALDARHNRIVLIKLLEAGATDTTWRAQLLQESRLSARLAHPNLRRIFQSGLASDEPYLVLEYVEGPTLAELIREHRKIPIELCIFIAKEIAKAIAAIHRNDVLHRDIKPQNVFLSLNGEVKLGDLGLAQELSEVDVLTAGTPAYMSPEQVLGREVTQASDLFSFGAVLYEMLTGESAFSTRTLNATLHHLVNWDPVPITTMRPEAPVELVEICRKLLAKNPQDRYPHAETVLELLRWLERGYGLNTTCAHLASFLESPETYCPAPLRRGEISGFDGTPKSKKWRHVSWGMTAVLNAIMFLAGVLFIKGVKTYFEYKATAALAYPNVSALHLQRALADRAGFLDLQVTPTNAPSVIEIEGEEAGVTPLPAPLQLSPGRHEIRIHHPHLGVRMMNVSISAGDTLSQTVDFSNP